MGCMESPDAVSEDVNELCGDRIRFQLSRSPHGVGTAMFLGDGCAISIATASILTEKVTGLGLDEVARISIDDVIEDLVADVKSGRRQCVGLPIKVLQDAAHKLVAMDIGK